MDAFHLVVPIQTRMWALKKFSGLQLLYIQDSCEHKTFKNGVCIDCDFKCEHSEQDDSHCLDCGEFVEPFIDEDFAYESARDEKLLRGDS